MREIKFRAWAHCGSLSEEDANNYVMWFSDEDFKFKSSFRITLKEYLSKDAIFMQYTGLKDKNGVEIYEGDVLKISNISVLRCEFRNGCFVLVHSKEFAGVDNLLWGNLGRLYDVGMNDIFELTEVIGNIYENPELLNYKGVN